MIAKIVILSTLAVLCSAQLRPLGLGLGLGARPLAAPLGIAPRPLALGGLAGLEAPEPYSFGFNAADEFGTQWTRQETADGSGAVRGSYGYRDGSGLFRTVNYVADDIGGFRAEVDSNEPGLVSSAPAAVTYRVGGVRK